MEDKATTTSPPVAPHRAISPRRYLLNLVLLIVLAVSLTIWFQRHLEFHFSKSLFVGGTLTFWALWNLVRGLVTWGAKKEVEALPHRILRGPASTEYLAMGLVLTFILYALTSSIHIEYVPTRDSAYEYQVELRYQTNDKPYLRDLRVTSAERQAGRPYFFRWDSIPLQAVLVEPRGFEPIPLEFGRGTRIHLDVPTDFQPKQYRLLRLVPGPRIRDHLAAPGESAQTTYRLELVRGGRTNRLDDWRYQTVYAGADTPDLERIVESEDIDRRHARYLQYLAGLGFPEEARPGRVEQWDTMPLYWKTDEFKSGDELRVTVHRAGEDSPRYDTELTLEDDDEIQTLFVDFQ